MKPLKDLAVYDDADFYDQEFAARTHDIPFFLDQAVRADGVPPSGVAAILE